MLDPGIIQGEIYEDQRGSLLFFNQFPMQEIVRLYEISPADTSTIRGWQGHRIEKKWFYCLKGTFIINVIRVDNFENPSSHTQSTKFTLMHTNPQVLYVPGGHATAIKAISAEARLQVYSDLNLEQSKQDDYRFPIQQWSSDWKT